MASFSSYSSCWLVIILSPPEANPFAGTILRARSSFVFLVKIASMSAEQRSRLREPNSPAISRVQTRRFAAEDTIRPTACLRSASAKTCQDIEMGLLIHQNCLRSPARPK